MCNVGFPASGENGDRVICVTPFFQNTTTNNPSSCIGSLLSNPLYLQYTKLYDEVKINGMVVKMTIASIVGDSTNPSVSVHTMFDRKGCYDDVSTSGAFPTGQRIKLSSSYMTKTFVNNSVCVTSRKCFAGDFIEKYTFHDCTVDETPTSRNIQGAGTNTIVEKSWISTNGNVNGFCPTFYLHLTRPVLSTAGSANVQLNIMYYVTFRNPKYGIAAGAKGVDVEPVRSEGAGKSSSDTKMEKKFTDEELDEVMEKLKKMGLIEEKEDEEEMAELN